jgi:hypothetical protein
VGGFEIDNKFEFGLLLHRKVAVAQATGANVTALHQDDDDRLETSHDCRRPRDIAPARAAGPAAKTTAATTSAAPGIVN